MMYIFDINGDDIPSNSPSLGAEEIYIKNTPLIPNSLRSESEVLSTEVEVLNNYQEWKNTLEENMAIFETLIKEEIVDEAEENFETYEQNEVNLDKKMCINTEEYSFRENHSNSKILLIEKNSSVKICQEELVQNSLIPYTKWKNEGCNGEEMCIKVEDYGFDENCTNDKILLIEENSLEKLPQNSFTIKQIPCISQKDDQLGNSDNSIIDELAIYSSNTVADLNSVYHCNNCNRQLNNKSILINHIKKCSMPKCLQGPKQTIPDKMAVKSQNGKLIYCKYCDNQYSDISTLSKHVETMHTTGDLVKFNFMRCKINYPADTSVYYECDHCNKRFSWRCSFAKHVKVHINDKRYICEFCGKRFVDKTHLKVHLRIHTNEKPFPCEWCGKKFKDKSNYIQHTRVHTEERPYKCFLCDKIFKQSAHLISHGRVHTKEKPYECDICNRKFSQKSILFRHVGIHNK